MSTFSATFGLQI